jgi:acyl-CoA synthetase (AMP-forming)/AMP-acid ligase II
MEFTTFNDMLRRTAWRKPDQTFIHWSDRNRQISYAEGDQISDKVAGGLSSLGVVKGDRVGIFAHNGLDYVMAMYGAWKLGAISAHISVLQKDNLAYFIHDSAPKILIYTGDMHPVIEVLKPTAPEVKHYVCLDGPKDFALDWSELIKNSPNMPQVNVDDMDAAHLSYTSGSSGPSKGALLAHGYTARATNAIAERLQMSSEDISLGVTSLSSSYHLVANLLPGIHRAVNIGVRKNWDAAEVWVEMDNWQVSLLVGNPLVLGDLLKEIRSRGRKPSHFRACVSGGAPVPPDLKTAFRDELGVHLVESYGQSELGGFVALGYPQKEPEKRFFAIGPGLPDRETRLVNEADDEQPVGQPGELVIRGGVMLGYWNMPDKTASVIKIGWLHTGDMGVMDDEGYFTLLGRWSERIIMDDKVIYPRYMEEALLSHPSVHYAGVIGRAHDSIGHVPVGVVQLWEGQVVTPEELLAHCKAMQGDECTLIDVIIIQKMPMTPTGKIGKQDLIKQFGK